LSSFREPQAYSAPHIPAPPLADTLLQNPGDSERDGKDVVPGATLPADKTSPPRVDGGSPDGGGGCDEEEPHFDEGKQHFDGGGPGGGGGCGKGGVVSKGCDKRERVSRTSKGTDPTDPRAVCCCT